MGRTKRKESRSDEKGQKRKRRRKARTDVSSDSDSSSSEGEVQVTNEDQDVEMGDTLTSNKPRELVIIDDEDDEDQDQEANEQESAKKFTEKGGRIPSPLRDLHDPQADAKFEEYYMRLITEEFGDDLNQVREAKDFEDRSLPMLIRALRQGVNIFDAGEKRAVVKEMA